MEGKGDCVIQLSGSEVVSTTVETIRSGPQNESEEVGSEGEGQKKNVRCEILCFQTLVQKNNEDYTEEVGGWVRSLQECGETKHWTFRSQEG